MGERLKATLEALRRAAPGLSWAWASLGVIPALLFAFSRLSPLGPEHYFASVAFVVLAWAGPRARQFSLVAAFFTLIALGYTLLGYLGPLRPEVHVADLWNADRALFPGPNGVSLADWISSSRHPLFDAVAGATYIAYLAEIVAIATWLFLRGDRARSLRLAITFALTNVIGWGVWLAFPAAPPWYVDLYGLGPAVLDAAPSAAGATRFDALVGVPMFSRFYAQNTNIFGAMPSLHCCYAVSSALVCYGVGKGMRVFTLAFASVMALSAVYLRHHYVLDVVAGVGLAVVVHLLLDPLFSNKRAAAASESERFELGERAAPECTS